MTGSYRLYKSYLPNRLDGTPEVGGVAPVKYSVGLRPPSVFDAPLRFVSRHLVCVLDARCLRVTCRFTFLLDPSFDLFKILNDTLNWFGDQGASDCIIWNFILL